MNVYQLIAELQSLPEEVKKQDVVIDNGSDCFQLINFAEAIETIDGVACVFLGTYSDTEEEATTQSQPRYHVEKGKFGYHICTADGTNVVRSQRGYTYILGEHLANEVCERWNNGIPYPTYWPADDATITAKEY
jgi:hypothetical protein